jgi:hypothetical protein
MKPIQSWNINGATVNIYPEFDSDWSWVDDNKTLTEIKNGTLFQVILEVKVYDKTGEVDGTDSLGGVVLKYSFKDDLYQQVLSTISDYGMIENAQAELKRKLENIFEAYQNETKP